MSPNSVSDPVQVPTHCERSSTIQLNSVGGEQVIDYFQELKNARKYEQDQFIEGLLTDTNIKSRIQSVASFAGFPDPQINVILSSTVD